MSDATPPAALPDWLVAPVPYEPPRDRDASLGRNVLALARLLAVFRAEPIAPSSPVDRALARVSPPARLVGVVALVLCVSLARSLAFVWVTLALVLVALALRPPAAIAALLPPALGVAVVSGLANLPAALALGQVAAPARVAAKTFVTVSLVCALARGVTPEELLGGLATLGLPASATMTIDLAVRDLALLGVEARSLAEALELRSVGMDRSRLASAAGVLGCVFVRAQRHAAAQAEAMALRGYDGRPAKRARRVATPATVAYLVAVLALVALFVWIEVAR